MDKATLGKLNVNFFSFGVGLWICFSTSSCIPAQQPIECEVALECVYEISDGGAVGQSNGFSEETDLRSPDNQVAVYDAFGENGECWKNGPMDAYYEICLETCHEILIEDCESSAVCAEVLKREGLNCDALERDPS